MSRELTSPPLSKVVRLGDAIEIGPASLTFRRELGYDEWAAIGEVLQRLAGSVMWLLGDWLRFGEGKFAEYSQVLPELPWKLETLYSAVKVADRIPPGSRRPKSTVLTWSHFQAVAYLTGPERERLLDAAEKNEWSRSQLREAVRAYRRQLKGSSGERKATPQQLRHVAREYRLELDGIESVVEPLVMTTKDTSLERLHSGVKDAVQKVIEYCRRNARQECSERQTVGDTGNDVQGSLAIGDESGIVRECPSCGGSKPLAWEVCGDCRLKQYATRREGQ